MKTTRYSLFAVLACLFVGAWAIQAKDDDDDKGKPKEPKSTRWRVSWAVDDDAAKMSNKPVRTTIAKLVTYKRPPVLPKDPKNKPEMRYRIHRVNSVEKTLWTIRGNVISVAHEHDGDYRLIVADAKGNVVCCVMPDPALAPIRGRWSDLVDQARAVTVKKFHPTDDPRTVKVPVEVTGFGYFGRINNDANPSPEGFQLHPVTKVRFPAK